MSIKNVEIQDNNGNIYYPHTDADVVKYGDNTVGEILSNLTYQVAKGTATVITLANLTLTDGYAITFIASDNNNGSGTTINGKPLYKPKTTTTPNLIKGKAYTVWYNSIGNCFFIKASAEGNTIASHVLAGDTFSNDNDTGIVGTMVNRITMAVDASHVGLGDDTVSIGRFEALNTWLGNHSLFFNVPNGYYDSSVWLYKSDHNFVAGNIRGGTSIFGLAGKASVVDTADANATASNIMVGYSGYVNGFKINGTKTLGYQVGDTILPTNLTTLPNEVWSITGHIGAGVAVGVDGYVYDGSKDNTVRKISPTGTQVWAFKGHTSDVNSVVVGGDGYVYSSSSDKTVRKISPTGVEVWSISIDVTTIAVGLDGYIYIGTGYNGGNVVKKISPTGVEVWSFKGHTSWIYCVTVGVDGYVYSSSNDGTVRKISSTGAEVWSSGGGLDAIKAVVVGMDGYVYTGTNGYNSSGSANEYSIRKISPTGAEVWMIEGNASEIYSLAIGIDGYIYSNASDNIIRKISPEENEIWSFSGNSVAVGIDNCVYIGSRDNTVKKIRQYYKILA